MHKETLGHLVRVLLIVCLAASAVLLARETGYYSRIFDRVSAKAAETAEVPGEQSGLSAAALAQAVRPRTVFVRTADGTAAASAYDGEITEEAFHRFSAILGEALGSAGEQTRVEEDRFRAGLSGESVYLDFFCDVPLELLARWLGSEMHGAAEKMRVRGLYLGVSDADVRLYYRGTDGNFYCCTTAALPDSLRTKMKEFQGTSAWFAWSDAALENADPYTVVLSELPEITAISGASVRGSVDTAQLMQILGMNSYLVSSYLEADGTRVWIDNEKTLRMTTDGTVSFREGMTESGQQTEKGISAAVSAAYELAVQSIGRCAGDADILLKSITAEGDDCYSVAFDYCVNGIPLRLSAESAAEITLRGGQPERVSLSLRSYAFTEQTETVLPMQQAAAIAAAAKASPALVYADNGESVQCVWIKD